MAFGSFVKKDVGQLAGPLGISWWLLLTTRYACIRCAQRNAVLSNGVVIGNNAVVPAGSRVSRVRQVPSSGDETDSPDSGENLPHPQLILIFNSRRSAASATPFHTCTLVLPSLVVVSMAQCVLSIF